MSAGGNWKHVKEEMTNALEDAIASLVLNMISTEKFRQWHENEFADYIGGQCPENHPEHTRDTIINDIKKMMGFE
jgi:hypothetical protein